MSQPAGAAPQANLLNDIDFVINTDPRCPCVLLLDTSKSMAGPRVEALNQGLLAFKAELSKDALAGRRVEIAIVTFGGQVRIIQDFVTVDNFAVPLLQAKGVTPMGTAIQTALDMVEERKARYNANAIPYYRPWIFLITDGAPEGEPPEVIEQAARRLHAAEASKHVAFFAVAVEGADIKTLSRIAPPSRPPVKLDGLKFVEMFVWLSRSTGQVAQAAPPTGAATSQQALPPVLWGVKIPD